MIFYASVFLISSWRKLQQQSKLSLCFPLFPLFLCFEKFPTSSHHSPSPSYSRPSPSQNCAIHLLGTLPSATPSWTFLSTLGGNQMRARPATSWPSFPLRRIHISSTTTRRKSLFSLGSRGRGVAAGSATIPSSASAGSRELGEKMGGAVACCEAEGARW